MVLIQRGIETCQGISLPRNACKFGMLGGGRGHNGIDRAKGPKAGVRHDCPHRRRPQLRHCRPTTTPPLWLLLVDSTGTAKRDEGTENGHSCRQPNGRARNHHVPKVLGLSGGKKEQQPKSRVMNPRRRTVSTQLYDFCAAAAKRRAAGLAPVCHSHQ